MNGTMEYIRKDPEFSQIYDRSIELQKLAKASETACDVDTLRQYAKELERQGAEMAQFLTKRYGEIIDKLYEIIDGMQKICTQLMKERDDIVSMVIEKLGIYPSEFYQMYKTYVNKVQAEQASEKKLGCHLKLIK